MVETKSDLIGKNVKVVFEDINGSRTFEGILKEYNDLHALLLTLGKLQSIPKERVIRIEVVDGGIR